MHSKHVSFRLGKRVIMYAATQRYSFGHRYELCMGTREIFKIYFFLTANYGVQRHHRGAWVPHRHQWEGINLFPQCLQIWNSNYTLVSMPRLSSMPNVRFPFDSYTAISLASSSPQKYLQSWKWLIFSWTCNSQGLIDLESKLKFYQLQAC